MGRETQGSPADEKKLEQYGVWVKVKPRDVTVPVLDEPFELSDLEPSKSARAPAGAAGGRVSAPGPSSRPIAFEDEVGSSENELTEEEEKLLDELETELEPDEGSTPAVSVPDEEPLLDDSELPDIESAAHGGSSDLELASEEDLPELEEDLEPAPSRRTAGPAAARSTPSAAEPAEVEVTLSEDVAEEESFDDLAALESELASVTTKTRAAAGSGTALAASGSTEILARIEDELKSIRADLTQLRTDLSGLRKSAAESDGKGSSAEAGIKGGFLDEDEDETIALTGDELDNILNTAEITEEEAETPAISESDLVIETPAEEGGADILGYDTPQPQPVEAPEILLDEELPQAALSDGDIADETLVLNDEDLLPADAPALTEAAPAEELPADLVLEEIPLEEAESASPVEGLPEIDLEGIPEIETETTAAHSAASAEDESETIDLETLDLGEEPKVIDAVAEQVEDIPELEAEEVLEADEAPVARRAADEELPEVDLEALAAEAEDLEEEVPEAPVVEDLEIGELESVADEAPAARTPEKEIEISFEGDTVEEAEELGEPVDEAEEVGNAEEVSAAEEVLEDAPDAEAGGGTAAIPDNLKDEIRTVLKYMDHLLEALPDEKIQEFASSDYFVMYKKLFEDLGLGE